ncbi:hypothetical protein [Mucilaginibacter sp. dw_454]|uniref:hypothetical protein n=1 Tax=Mucilaginibacter sp. dw_454 TaxID=2720079 RepID=UPI001BD2E716|nr:hypothetical protein [Mucilaginibacter sp. dw_454]
MKNQKLEGIEISLKNIFPYSSTKSIRLTSSELVEQYNYRGNIEKKAGYINHKNDFLIWFKSIKDGDNFIYLVIAQRDLKFTSNEITLLKQVPEILQSFYDDDESDFVNSQLRLAIKLSFETLLIAKYLRRKLSKRYSTIANIIFLLQNLTFKRYEKGICTSGFIYTNEIITYLKRLDTEVFDFEEFGDKFEVTPDFFDSPASYRYVDGKNSFFVVDNHLAVQGILSLKDPKKYNIVERLNHQHIDSLVDKSVASRRWISYVGINNDVKIILPNNTTLKWSENHWRIQDFSIIEDILKSFDIDQQNSKILINYIIALSELRLGSVILIPRNENNLPEVIGKIDNTKLGKALRETFVNKNINNISKKHLLLGILSSDGLTTISKSGNIISCGDIIKIDHNDPTHQGGGRSQASLSASKFGLSIKVSEDGPISIYCESKRIFQF